MNVLFVCTGNTCRSPMAEKILKSKAAQQNIPLEVKSAGIFAAEGQQASKNAQSVMAEYKMPTEHQAQRVTEELLNWADLVLTMTIGHKQILLEQFPSETEKVYTLKEYENNDPSIDIHDPFGGDLDIYRETAEEIEKAIEAIIKLYNKDK